MLVSLLLVKRHRAYPRATDSHMLVGKPVNKHCGRMLLARPNGGEAEGGTGDANGNVIPTPPVVDEPPG